MGGCTLVRQGCCRENWGKLHNTYIDKLCRKAGEEVHNTSLTTYKLQSKDAGQFKSRLAIAKQSTSMRRLFINYNQICQLQGNRNCIVC